MGQRTQVFIETNDLDGNVKNYFFHQQWGYGKGLVRRLMKVINEIEIINAEGGSSLLFEEAFDFSKIFYQDIDLFDEYNKYKGKENTDKYRYSKLSNEEVLDLIYGQDNDDGYLVIKLKSIEYPYDFRDISFAFYDRKNYRKDNKDDLEFFTMKEYLEQYAVVDEDREEIDYLYNIIDYFSKQTVEIHKDIDFSKIEKIETEKLNKKSTNKLVR